MKITKLTIGRLYNLGSYEHVRYEVSVEVPEGESAATAMLGLEKIIAGLSPKTHTHSRDDLNREALRLEIMGNDLGLSEDEFRRKHGFFEGTPLDYLRRCNESHNKSVAERDAWEKRGKQARFLLDDLGGAANWKDAKLDWENDEDFW
jgi:hypothetical protein